MVCLPDPKQYKNSWKNDAIASYDQLGETVQAAPTLTYLIKDL